VLAPKFTSRHSRNTILSLFSGDPLIQYVPPLHRPSLAYTFVSTHSIMARFVMPSLTPHYANNSPWSVSVNLTFSQAEDFLRQFFSAVLYHIHTAILFTWTDYKTIFLPIVSILFLLCYLVVMPCFADCLRLCDCTRTVLIQPVTMLVMDLVPPTPVQCVQPSPQL
jgi:hypothetical protein